MADQLSALRLFVRVARTGSFSRVAREQAIAQPTVSRIIAGLEQEIGAALFTRTTRALSLTDAGAAYLERVEPLLDALDEANHDARGTGELRGVLRVGLSSTLAVRMVIPVLPTFADAHPALRIELLIDDRRQDLVVDGVDVALRFGAMPDSSAVAKKIATWPRAIAASPGYLDKHAARHGAIAEPADLAAGTAIVAQAGSGGAWMLARDGRHESVRAHAHVVVTLNEAALAAAVAGLGIVSTSLEACRRELESGALVRLLPEWDAGSIDLHAVFASGRSAKPAARAFAAFLAGQLGAR